MQVQFDLVTAKKKKNMTKHTQNISDIPLQIENISISELHYEEKLTTFTFIFELC